MTVLTTQSVLAHVKDRLRANYVEAALYDDADVLVLINDAYRDACEQSQCLQGFETLTLTTASEYALPDGTSQVFSVFVDGIELERVSLADALGTVTWASYYVYGQTIGFLDQPDGVTSAIIHYAATPATLANYEAALDPRFPVEYADVLVHYVRWRVQVMSGGAERGPQAQVDRQIYDQRVGQLRRSVEALDATGRRRFVTDTERIGSAQRAS